MQSGQPVRIDAHARLHPKAFYGMTTKRRRYRTPRAKPGELLIRYGQEDGERDLYYCHGGEGATRADTNLLMDAFNTTKLLSGKTLIEELTARGYDLETLRFSIQQKPRSTGDAHEP